MATIQIPVPQQTLSEPGQTVVVPSKTITTTVPASVVTGPAQSVLVPARNLPLSDTALAAMLVAAGWTCTAPAPPAPIWPPLPGPWTAPIPAAATYISVPALQSGLGANAGQQRIWWAANMISVSWATAADPLTTIHLPASWNWPASTVSMHVQAAVAPPGNGDNTVVFVDTTAGLVVDLWQAVKAADGSWSSAGSSGAQCTLSSTGWGVLNGKSAGIRAVGCTALGGLIMPQDIAAGAINHTLALVLPSEMIASGFVPPATNTDSGSMNGPIPEGALVAIPRGTPKPASFNDPQGSMIWDAMVKFGARVVDNCGGAVDPVIQYAIGVPIGTGVVWPFPTDMNVIGQNTKLVYVNGALA